MPLLRTLGTGLCTAALLVALAVPACAAVSRSDIAVEYAKFKVTLDEKKIGLADANGKKIEPFAYNNTVYLPVRAIADALGLRVDWLPGSHTVALTKAAPPEKPKKATGSSGSKKTVVITVDYNDIKITLDNAPVLLQDAQGNPVEPFMYNDTTYLPVRAVADAMDLAVDFDAKTSTVVLTSLHPPLDEKQALLFVKGTLDKLYLEKYDPAYLKLVAISENWAKVERQEKLDLEAEFFGRYFAVPALAAELEDADSAAARKVVQALYADIFAKAKYQVGPATAARDGTFRVEVKLTPLDLIQKFSKDERAAAQTAALAAAKLTQEQLDALPPDQRLKYDRAHAEALEKALRGKLSGMGYLSAETVTVTVQRDETGAYMLTPTDLDQIDSRILYYP